MAKKITQQTANSFAIIQNQLKKLRANGYAIDFVEDSHVIVDVAAMREELQKPSSEVNLDNYVVAHLS